MPLDEIFHTQMSASAAARRAKKEYTAGAMGDRGNFAGGKQPEVFPAPGGCIWMCSAEAQTLKLKDEMKQKLRRGEKEGWLPQQRES